MADVHSPETRSYNMSRIRSKGTKIEKCLASALWSRGLRYRKNDKSVLGKPDFVFQKIKLAIFCDSEFWHGKDFDATKDKIGTNKDFWISKIQSNRIRDEFVNKELSRLGWTVLRYWGKDILKNTDLIADEILTKFSFLQIGIKKKIV